MESKKEVAEERMDPLGPLPTKHSCRCGGTVVEAIRREFEPFTAQTVIGSRVGYTDQEVYYCEKCRSLFYGIPDGVESETDRKLREVERKARGLELGEVERAVLFQAYHLPHDETLLPTSLLELQKLRLGISNKEFDLKNS